MWISRGELRRLLCALRDARREGRVWERRFLEERERNLAHEDELLNRLLTRAGSFPLTARSRSSSPLADSSSTLSVPAQAPPSPSHDPLFEQFLADAEEAGRSRADARRDYEIFRRTGRLPFQLSSEEPDVTEIPAP